MYNDVNPADYLEQKVSRVISDLQELVKAQSTAINDLKQRLDLAEAKLDDVDMWQYKHDNRRMFSDS